MVDDLDDLLLESEESSSVDNFKEAKNELEHFNSRKIRSQLSVDINEILALDLDDHLEKTFKPTTPPKPNKVKCNPIYIAGTNYPKGYGNAVVPNACSALYCRHCDFKVSCFSNFEWKEEVDYLFLRTNMPILEKIIGKLKKKNGSIAYACHCVSYSTTELRSLCMIQSLPWFCRGHVL